MRRFAMVTVVVLVSQLVARGQQDTSPHTEGFLTVMESDFTISIGVVKGSLWFC